MVLVDGIYIPCAGSMIKNCLHYHLVREFIDYYRNGVIKYNFVAFLTILTQIMRGFDIFGNICTSAASSSNLSIDLIHIFPSATCALILFCFYRLFLTLWMVCRLWLLVLLVGQLATLDGKFWLIIIWQTRFELYDRNFTVVCYCDRCFTVALAPVGGRAYSVRLYVCCCSIIL